MPALRAYPNAPTSDAADDYHGTKIADPYRPLKNPDSPETRKWIEAENRLTESWLTGAPDRAKLLERLTTLWNYERYSPLREGGLYFFQKNDGLQNQAVLYVLPRLDAALRVLLDPNALSKEGTVALSGYAVSTDGKHLAYGLAAAGSDWNEWRVSTWRPEGRPARSPEVGQVLRRCVDEGREGVLLLAIRRAEARNGAGGRRQEPEALLSPARHAPVRGPSRLRAS